MTEKRVGIFGGSFDPVHIGHLLLAEFCREQANLDFVVFVPTAVSPHKVGSNPVSADDRVEMLRLAIAGHPHFAISTTEIDRGGVSYTVETLHNFAKGEGLPDSVSPVAGHKLFFLMGADSLEDFPTWRNPNRICELATLLIVSRPGSEDPDFSLLEPFSQGDHADEPSSLLVKMPLIDISSTEIRNRAAANESIRFQTPRAVEKYIEANKVYVS